MGVTKERLILHGAQQGQPFLSKMFLDAHRMLANERRGFRFLVTRPSGAFLREVKKLRTDDSETLTIEPWILQETLAEILSRCMFYSHFKSLETFGILCAEAMSYGAIPIVYRSPLNATWVDILREGRFGLGFSSAREFVDSVAQVADDRNMEENLRERAIFRSQCFGVERFHEQFLSCVQ